jgi:hypothetical protein
MNYRLWITAGVMLVLSFVLDLSTRWFSFVPYYFSSMMLWTSASVCFIALILVILESVLGRKD